MIKLINSQQFIYFYNRMSEEFPPSEMKSLDDFLGLLKEGKYICVGYFHDQVMVGYALGLLTSKKFFWLDYLQIFMEYQNGGFGTLLLKSILKESIKKIII